MQNRQEPQTPSRHLPQRLSTPTNPLTNLQTSLQSTTHTLAVIIDLFRALPHVLFCVKRPDGSYANANLAFAQRCGKRHPAEIIDRTAAELFPSELARSYEAQDRAVLSTGRPVTNQLELISRNDGNLGWFLTSKTTTKANSAKNSGSRPGWPRASIAHLPGSQHHVIRVLEPTPPWDANAALEVSLGQTSVADGWPAGR